MKTLPSAITDYRNLRQGVYARILIWISAKNRSTGATESMGFWNGDDHRQFTINGQVRTYYGAGDLLEVDEFTTQVGIQIRERMVTLSAISAEVKQAIRGYDVRLAPAEIHRVEFSTETGSALAEPQQLLNGWVDKSVISRGASKGIYSVSLKIVDISRALTKTLTQKYSDASQRKRDANDDFFQYTDVSGSADFYWGEKRAGSNPNYSDSAFVRWAMRRANR